MSNNMKHKIRDRFYNNNHPSIKITITEIKQDILELEPYKIEYSDGDFGYCNEMFFDDYYTKINEPLNVVRDDTTSEQKTIMNIEENKHHLIWGDTQSIELIEDFLSKEEYIGFLKGNILKYQLRLGKKDDVAKELKKIQDYTNELNKLL